MGRVLLYSAVPIVIKGFAVLLAAASEFDLVAVCSDERQLSRTISATSPDLVLVDLDDETLLDRIFEMRREGAAAVPIVLWVSSISPELAYRTMRLGVRGILRRSFGADVILKCLQRVAEGECWFEEALTSSFAEIPTASLTEREDQLLSLVSQGFKNKEIAEALSLAEPTVKIYLSRLFRKVGAKDRLSLALYALRSGVTGQVNMLGAGGTGRTDSDAEVRPRPRAVRSIA